MVFVSLEGFIDANDANASSLHSSNERPHEQLPKPSMYVVVTPGSPAKMASDIIKRSRFSLPAAYTSSTSSTSSSSISTPFVVYVTDTVVPEKWVLTKLSSDYKQLRKALHRAVGSGCKQFSCCGPLRRIVKSPLYRTPRRKWNEAAHVSQYGKCSVIEEYINDLLHGLIGRGSECENTKQARHIIEQFLEVDKRRMSATDRLIANATFLNDKPEDSLCESNDEEENNDDRECTICCSQLSDGKIWRLQCGHFFHTDCVRVWFNVQHTCPVCRIHLDDGCES